MPVWAYVLAIIGIGAVTSIYLVTLSAFDVAVKADVPKHRVFKINAASENSKVRAQQRANDEWLASRHFEELAQETTNGLKKGSVTLFARILRAKKPTHKWVMIFHGFGGQGLREGTRARHFHKMGYNIFLPDLRGCGKSGGEYLGMGWLDSMDMLLWLGRILEIDPEASIVLYGGSMGGATTMMTTGWDLPPQVKAAVEDCGYTSVWDIFRYQLKKVFNLSRFPWLVLGNLMCRRLAGYSFRQASSVEQLKKSRTPTLFIHGTDDGFVPFWMLDVNYEAAACPNKKKLIIDGAHHNRSMFKDPKLYWSTVEEFIRPYMEDADTEQTPEKAAG